MLAPIEHQWLDEITTRKKLPGTLAWTFTLEATVSESQTPWVSFGFLINLTVITMGFSMFLTLTIAVWQAPLCCWGQLTPEIGNLGPEDPKSEVVDHPLRYRDPLWMPHPRLMPIPSANLERGQRGGSRLPLVAWFGCPDVCRHEILFNKNVKKNVETGEVNCSITSVTRLSPTLRKASPLTSWMMSTAVSETLHTFYISLDMCINTYVQCIGCNHT